VIPTLQPLRESGTTLRYSGALIIAASILVGIAACDDGLVVPDQELAGAIAGEITYLNLESWPPDSAIFDLRFVAMRFIPTDTADFLQLNRMEISNGLRRGVATDTFFIGGVDPGTFPYSGVAYQFSADIFDWRPIGVVTENNGLFSVANGETTHVHVVVDFNNPPVFPPEL